MDSNVNYRKVLVCGLGGIGGQIVGQMSTLLNEEARKNCRLVCFDTDAGDLKYLDNQYGIKGIQTSSNLTVQDYLNEYPEQKEWFMENPLLVNKTMLEGAGQVRQVSRMASDTQKIAIENALVNALTELRQSDGSAFNSGLKVVVVCSITGGTGAGMVVQLPFMIRRIVNSHFNIKSFVIRGLFIGPEISECFASAQTNIHSLYANAYAVIKELNAFYDAQYKNASEIAFSLPEYIKGPGRTVANPIPYDFAFIVEKANREGDVLGTKEFYKAAAAEILYQQMFTGLSSNLFSAEDNQILSHVQKRGMDRFGGAGTSHAEYPVNEIVKYIALRKSNDSISDFWTMIDREVDEQIKQANENPDPDRPEPDPRALFCEGFDRHTTGLEKTKEFVQARKTFQFKQSLTTDESVDVDLLQSFEDALEEFNTTCQFSEARKREVKVLWEAVLLDRNSGALSDAEDDLQDEKKRLSDISEKNPLSDIDKILPLRTNVSLVNLKNAENCYLPKLLSAVHPLAARYILSNLFLKINESIADFNEDIKINENSVNLEGTLQFREVQKALETVAKKVTRSYRQSVERRSNAGSRSHLEEDKTIKPELKALEDALNDYVEQFYVQKQLAVETYYQKLYLKRLYTELAFRIEQLLKAYESFFAALPDLLTEKRRTEEDMLRQHERNETPGIIYICADSFCKDRLYEEIDNADTRLPEEACEHLFRSLFQRGAVNYLSALRLQKERRSGRFSSNEEQDTINLHRMKSIYEQEVNKTYEEIVRKHAWEKLDIGIKAAIEKEALLRAFSHEDILAGESLPAEKRTEVINAVFSQLRQMAVPYFSAVAGSDIDMRVYFTMNNRGFVYGDHPSAADKDKAMDSYRLHDYENFIVETFFDENRIYAYRAEYGYPAWTLNRYKKGAPTDEHNAWNAYHKRIESILYTDFEGQDAEQVYQEYVSPHLDKRWCEPYFIQEIDPDAAASERYNGFIAFILAVEYDFCNHMQEKDTSGKPVGGEKWWSRGEDSFLKFSDGTPLNGSYYDLLLYFRRNSVASDFIDHIDDAVIIEEQKRYSVGSDFLDLRPMKYFLNDNDLPYYKKEDGTFENSTPSILRLITETARDSENKDYTIRALVKVFCYYLLWACDQICSSEDDANDKYELFMRALEETSKTPKDKTDTGSEGAPKEASGEVPGGAPVSASDKKRSTKEKLDVAMREKLVKILFENFSKATAARKLKLEELTTDVIKNSARDSVIDPEAF